MLCSILKDSLDLTQVYIILVSNKKKKVLKKHTYTFLFYYVFVQVIEEEKKIPLAFSILCHSNLGILETLLASIFRPQNYYCIYVDNKAPVEFLNNAKRLINAYKIKFPKTYIFLAKDPRMNIYWGSSTLLEAGLACMEQLLKRSRSQNVFFFFKMQSAYITLTYYFFGSIQTSRNSWKMEVFLQYCWNGVTNETNTRNHKNSGKIA